MSSHRHIRLLLYDYAACQLEHERRSLVRRHLELCAECREEYEELRTVMEKLSAESNPSADLPPPFWQELLNDVTAQLPVRPKRQSVPVWVSDWMEFISIPHHQVIVGATMVLVLGAILSGMWFAFRHEPDRTQIAATTAVEPQPRTPAVNTRLKEYLRKSKVLLVGLNNMPLEEGTAVDLSMERTTSRALLHEARYLKDQPLDGRSAALIADLEKIQIALANIREREGLPGLKLIRGGIQEENLLFKIRIAETVFTRLQDETQHADQ